MFSSLRGAGCILFALFVAGGVARADLDRLANNPQAKAVVCGHGSVSFLAMGNARRFDNPPPGYRALGGDLVVMLDDMSLANSEMSLYGEPAFYLPSEFGGYETTSSVRRVINFRRNAYFNDIFEAHRATLHLALITRERIRITSEARSGAKCDAQAHEFQINTCGFDEDCYGTSPRQ